MGGGKRVGLLGTAEDQSQIHGLSVGAASSRAGRRVLQTAQLAAGLWVWEEVFSRGRDCQNLLLSMMRKPHY